MCRSCHVIMSVQLQLTCIRPVTCTGDKPNLADLSVFGAIRSVTSTDTFMDLMHNTAIGGWYEHMMGAVGESTRLPSYD